MTISSKAISQVPEVQQRLKELQAAREALEIASSNVRRAELALKITIHNAEVDIAADSKIIDGYRTQKQ